MLPEGFWKGLRSGGDFGVVKDAEAFVPQGCAPAGGGGSVVGDDAVEDPAVMVVSLVGATARMAGNLTL